MTRATSSGSFARPSGLAAARVSSRSPMLRVISVRLGPSATALTRTPAGPNSAAHERSTPPARPCPPRGEEKRGPDVHRAHRVEGRAGGLGARTQFPVAGVVDQLARLGGQASDVLEVGADEASAGLGGDLLAPGFVAAGDDHRGSAPAEQLRGRPADARSGPVISTVSVSVLMHHSSANWIVLSNLAAVGLDSQIQFGRVRCRLA